MQVAVPSWVRSARALAGISLWCAPAGCGPSEFTVLASARPASARSKSWAYIGSTLLTLGTEVFAWRIPTCQAQGPGSESNKVCWGKRRRHPSRGPRERTPPAAPPPAPPPRDAASSERTASSPAARRAAARAAERAASCGKEGGPAAPGLRRLMGRVARRERPASRRVRRRPLAVLAVGLQGVSRPPPARSRSAHAATLLL